MKRTPVYPGLQNQLRGIIALQEVEQQLQRNPSTDWVTAAGLTRTDLQIVTSDTGLREALESFHNYHDERLPVVNDRRDRVLLGYVSKTDLLLALAHAADRIDVPAPQPRVARQTLYKQNLPRSMERGRLNHWEQV